MRIARKSLGFSMAGFVLAFGCGGRSDAPEYYSDMTGEGGFGGTHPTPSRGGTTSVTGSGGMPASGGLMTKATGGTVARGGGPMALGGVPSKATGGYVGKGGVPATGGATFRGGATSKGGTTAMGGKGGAGGSAGTTAVKGACCSVHTSTGCNSPTIEQCVCKSDAICCSVGWDPICVNKVASLGCGACPTGGTGGVAGTSGGSGGVPSNGGSTAVAGSAGSVATAGSIATGGATTATGGAPATGGAAASLALIDDLEDGNGDIIVIDGRQGYWFTFNDATLSGTQLPVWAGRIFTALPILDRDGSTFAAWTQGNGFTTWGGGIGFYLNGPGGFYSANKYIGITFWAKIEPGRANVVRMSISDSQTVSDGGYCSACWDDFGMTIIMSTTWQRYSYLWADLRQGGWGAPLAPAINAAKLRSIEFGNQQGVDFGIYVDDVAFIP